jgi:uncharacterized protein with HEPN domain
MRKVILGRGLNDILQYAEKAERFVEGLEYQALEKNEEKTLAVIRALEVIGEAARHIPESLRSRYSEVPWEDMTSMRNKLIHDYFGVDLKVVWRTLKEDLPPLRSAVSQILADLDAEKHDQ